MEAVSEELDCEGGEGLFVPMGVTERRFEARAGSSSRSGEGSVSDEEKAVILGGGGIMLDRG